MGAFHENLSTLRLVKDLSQKELAIQIGVTRDQISNWEIGRGMPNKENLIKVAGFFSCSVDYLLGNSPFKTTKEERSSITIAALYEILNQSKDPRPAGYLRENAHSLLESSQKVYTADTLNYLSNLLERLPAQLFNMEYYDLALFAVNGIQWPSDYRGPVLVKIRNEVFPVSVDYWSIPALTLDDTQSKISYLDKDIKRNTELILEKKAPEELNNPPDFLQNNSMITPIGNVVSIPIVGKISCGKGTYAYEDIEGYEPTPKSWLNGEDHFYLRVEGDSMVNARIYDGDLVLIRKQSQVDNGEIAAVLIDGTTYLKRVFFDTDKMILQSENPKYPPIVCDPGTEYDCQVIGKLRKIVISL